MYLDGTMLSTGGFLLAASRLGKLDTPIWCFDDTPFFPLPVTDALSTSALTTHTVFVQYPGNKFFAWDGVIDHIACESII